MKKELIKYLVEFDTTLLWKKSKKFFEIEN